MMVGVLRIVAAPADTRRTGLLNRARQWIRETDDKVQSVEIGERDAGVERANGRNKRGVKRAPTTGVASRYHFGIRGKPSACREEPPRLPAANVARLENQSQ